MPTSSWFDYLRLPRYRAARASHLSDVAKDSPSVSAPATAAAPRIDKPAGAKPAAGIWSEIIIVRDKPVAHKISQSVVARLVHYEHASVSLIPEIPPESHVCPWIKRAALPLPY